MENGLDIVRACRRPGSETPARGFPFNLLAWAMQTPLPLMSALPALLFTVGARRAAVGLAALAIMQRDARQLSANSRPTVVMVTVIKTIVNNAKL